MFRRRRLMLYALPLILLVIALVAWRVLWPARPADLGLVDGRLRPCPASPNCVSSRAPPEDAVHRIEPFDFLPGGLAPSRARLIEVLEASEGAVLVTRGEDYLHAEFTTPRLRFVDDVEFELDADAGKVQVRSASRSGHSDLGANRKRVESLRRRYDSSIDHPNPDESP